MILIDTGPLVALCHPVDSHHRKSMRQLEAFAPGDLATCEAMLVEAWFHLPRDIQRDRLRALLEDQDIAVLPGAADRAFRDEVFDWLQKYADHVPDWTDGCIAVLSGRDHTLKVWTYDGEFYTIWRRPDGTRIPLAV